MLQKCDIPITTYFSFSKVSLNSDVKLAVLIFKYELRSFSFRRDIIQTNSPFAFSQDFHVKNPRLLKSALTFIVCEAQIKLFVKVYTCLNLRFNACYFPSSVSWPFYGSMFQCWPICGTAHCVWHVLVYLSLHCDYLGAYCYAFLWFVTRVLHGSW